MTIWDFNNTRPYVQGDYCFQEGILYKLKAVSSLGPWAPGNWSKIESIRPAVDIALATVANIFSTSTSYVVGDYVIYEDSLYKCIEDTSGQWAAAKWELVTVMSQFNVEESNGNTND